MTLRAIVAAALLAICPGLSSLAAAQNVKIVEADKAYVHKPTGMSFPPSVGNLRRDRVIEYDGDATDVSAGYNLDEPDGRIVLTIFIFPAPLIEAGKNVADEQERKCGEIFEGVKGEVFIHPGAKLIDEGDIASPSASHMHPGRPAVFTLDGMAYVEVKGPLRSEADLFCYVGDKWLILYRATAPAGIAYERQLAELMHGIAWPSFPTRHLTLSESGRTALQQPITQASAPHP